MPDLMGDTLAAGQAAAQNAPDPGPQMHQGLQAGLELAQREEQIQQFKAQMDFKRQELDEQKREHFVSGIENVHKLAIDNPQLAKKMYPGVWNVGAKLGVVEPLAPDQEKLLFSDNADKMNQILGGAIKAYYSGDPKQKADAFEQISSLSQADQITLFNEYNSALKPDVAVQSNIARGNGQMGVAAINQGGNPAAIMDLIHQREATADPTKKAAIDQQIQTQLGGMKAQQGIGNQKARTTEVVRHNQAEEDIQRQKNLILKDGLNFRKDTTDRRLYSGAFGKVVSTMTPYNKLINQANADLKLLDKNKVLLRDGREAVLGAVRLVQGVGQLPMARDQSMQFEGYGKAIQDFFDKNFVGSEDTVMNPQQVQVLRDRIQRLHDNTKTSMDRIAGQSIDGYTNGRIFRPEEADRIKQVYGISNASPAAGAAPAAPGAPAGKMVTIGGKSMTVQQARQFGNDALTKGAPADKVKKMFKDATGEDL